MIRILLTLIALGAHGCAIDSRVRAEWSYLRPPQPGSAADVPAGGVWCDAKEKAVFMATTGFFTTGCSSSRLIARTYKVIGVEHIAANDVRAWVVQVNDSRHNVLWIPLPDHNWARIPDTDLDLLVALRSR